MHAISSSWTIFFRLFLPVFWLVFFGAFGVALFLYRSELGPVLGHPHAIYYYTVFYICGILFFYFTSWKIFRVDADADFFYVTNYIKTYKYPFHQVVTMEEQDILFFDMVTISLAQKFSFGKKIRFLANKKKWQSFLNDHADKLRHLQTD